MARTPSLGIFKQQKYKKITINDGKGQDGQGTPAGHLSPASTDGLANNAEAVLSFFHVPSESDVFFKSFITTFAESYNCDWNPDTVFGRTDPIYTFKNTTRSITLGWKIPAETIINIPIIVLNETVSLQINHPNSTAQIKNTYSNGATI